MSLFQELYRYRQTESGNQQENYLTELLAYVLQHDKIFRTEFLKLFSIITTDNTSIIVKTQTPRQFGADIIIEAYTNDRPEWILHLENKINSAENWNPKMDIAQLNTYDNVLKDTAFEKKYLLFLTVKPWQQGNREFTSTFAHRRWYEVYKVLESIQLEQFSITGQFKEYLKNLELNKSHQFSTLDNFDYYNEDNQYILDEVLDFAKEKRKELFEDILSVDKHKRTTFAKRWNNYTLFSFIGGIGLHIGFAKQQFNINKPHAYIFINKSNLENEKWQELITKMGECKWTSIDNDCIWFGKYFLLSELPTEENTKEHTNILKDWLKEEIEKLSPYKTIF